MNEFFQFLIDVLKVFSGGIIGGVLGYLLKTQIDHRLAITRNYEVIRVSEFNKAAATFRAAFVDEIYLLRSSVKYGNKTAGNILNEVPLIKHEKAKIMFEPFLTGAGLQGFNSAWNNYRNYKNNYIETEEPFNPYKHNGEQKESCDHVKHECQYCLDHINHLLSFAEPKTST